MESVNACWKGGKGLSWQASSFRRPRQQTTTFLLLLLLLTLPTHSGEAPPFLSLPTTELARAASSLSLSLSLLGQAIMPPSPRHIPPLLHSLARDTQGKEKWKKDVLGEKEMPVCPSPPPLPPLLLSSVPFSCLFTGCARVRSFRRRSSRQT